MKIISTFGLAVAGLMTIHLSAFADEMTDMANWCSNVSRPSSVVICSDPELRYMAVVRNKMFDDARTVFSPDDMKELNSNQHAWIQAYTARCGASIDGPPVSFPIPRQIVECYKREGRLRIEALVGYLREDIPNYQQPNVTGWSPAAEAEKAAETERHRAEEAQRLADAERQRAADAERAEQARKDTEAARQRAAEVTRRQLEKQAAENALKDKLNELGFQLLTAADLNLDWKSYLANQTKVAVRGTYVSANDMEVLSTPENKDQQTIRLYTDNASRDARKLMLDCRNSEYKFSMCQMVIAATIQSCIRNKGELNERQIPCLHVQGAYLIPDATRP